MRSGSSPCESITRTENDYQIRSQDCSVEVRVNSTAPDRPGPTRFSLSIGTGQCS
jgi:hypothetical protein